LIEIDRLTKIFPSHRALNACSLSIPAGTVFGLLGPNGAGKTTLIRLLLGFMKPTSGHATIARLDCQRQSVAVRQRVAYLPAEARLFRGMRAAQVLRFFAELHPAGNHQRSLEVARRLELDLKRRVLFMSTGMRQKLAICCVLGCHTPVLILDEPTANLDPTVRYEILQLIRETRQRGQTVLFSSHVLSEIEEVCDALAILRRGEVVHQMRLADLDSLHHVRGRVARSLPGPWRPDQLPEGVRWVTPPSDTDRGVVELELTGPLERHIGWLSELDLSQLRIEPAGLKSVYARYHFESLAATD
jgi:ABC-2 type transport system ATP-binding protein